MAVTKALNILAPIIDTPNISSSTGSSFTTTTWLDLGQFEQVRYEFLISQGTTNTFDALLLQATSSAGAGAKVITGKALTQIVNGTVNATIKTAEIIVKATDLDTNNSFRYVKAVATCGSLSNANVIAINAEGADVRTSPQTSTVTQSVN